MSNQNVHLVRFITRRYSLEELKTLCFSLGIEYEELPGWTRSARVREFLLQAGEQQKFEALLNQLQQDRPIPFNQAGLSTESDLVQRLYDDLDEYRERSRPFYQKWTEQFQRRALISLGLVFVALIGGVVFLYLSLRTVGPKRMNGTFTIAIVEFGQVDENGRVHASKAGADLSATIFRSVQEEMADFVHVRTVNVWHNEREPKPGVRLDFLPGDTREERARAAADLAKKINARLIIYGNFRQFGQGTKFLPEFYVSDLQDAGELVGAHTLGSEILIPARPGSLAETFFFDEEISARTNALTLFAIGLTFEAMGQPNRALEMFHQAEAIKGWDDEEGKEVLYLFIGREANILWLEGEDRGEEVLEAMQKAVELNPKYGRAYIGLGNYYVHTGEQQFENINNLHREEGKGFYSEAVLQASSRFNQDTNQAVRYYRKALDNLPATGGALVETKVHLSLGGAHIRQADLLYITAEYDSTVAVLDLALAEYEEAYEMAADDDYRHQALAQLGIAIANRQKGNVRQVLQDPEESQVLYKEALASYDDCITLAKKDGFDWFLKDFKEEHCEPGRQDMIDALARLKGERS